MADLRYFTPLHPRYNPASYKLTSSYIDRDLPLRAKSVSLTERSSSKYQRQIHSAGHTPKQFFPTKITRPTSTANTYRQKTVLVKQQNRKSIEKVPCAVSVQTISIPMKYANYSHSTSKTHQNLCNVDRIDNRTKSSNPSKQVGDNKRLCTTVGCGKETENRLLLQIKEANQVGDFERILNCNAIERSRAPRHEWRAAGAVLPRPRSAYSLHAVSQAYHYLFQQHHDSLQPLIDAYRQTEPRRPEQPPPSLLQDNWYENLQNLSEFYEDDPVLKRKLEAVNDNILSEELKATKTVLSSSRNKNFNVNLTDLIGLHVSGEGFSPGSHPEPLSPDVDKGDHEVYDEKEWLTPIMSSDDRQHSELKSDSVECLTENLNSVKIDDDGKVPTITFSNCCDGCNKSEPINTEIDIHLTVPSIDSINETRPPMM